MTYRFPRKVKSKSKRNQKKHFLGKWAEIGFSIGGEFIGDSENFMDDFITFIDDRNLDCGGGCNDKTFGFIIHKTIRYGKVSEDEAKNFIDEFSKTFCYCKIINVNYNIDMRY